MKIIDSHQHFWRYDPLVHHWISEEMKAIRKDFLPSDLALLLKNNQVEGCVSVQVEQSERETEFLLDLAEKYDLIKAVVGWVDLCAANVEERLGYFSRHSAFKGIRHTVYDNTGEFLLDPDFQNGIQHLGSYKLSFDILVFDHQLASAVSLVRKFPNQIFILNHLAKPDTSSMPTNEWIEQMKILGHHENVVAKISGMFTQAANFEWSPVDFRPFFDVMLDSFGPQRLMYGSDWPVSQCAATYEETISVLQNYLRSFGEEVLADIFRNNAIRFYRL